MGAAPIVSGGLQVAGAISNLSSQRRERNRQLMAVNQQIAADAAASAARLAEQQNQRQYLLQTYQLESMQRRLQNDPTLLAEAAVQNKLQNTVNVGQLQNAGASATRQLADANVNALAGKVTADAGADTEFYQTLLEAAKTDSEVAQTLAQLEQGVGTSGREIAALLATQRGRVPTQADEALQGYNDKIYSEVLQALNQADGLSSQAAQNVLNSEDFANFVRQISAEDLAGTRETLSRQLGAVTEMTDTGLKLQDLGYNYNQASIDSAAKLFPIQSRVQENQADLDFLTGMSGINANVGAITGQSIARRTQLLSSVPAKPGFLSTVANIGSASLPLISNFIGSKSGPFFPQQQQPSTLVDVYPDNYPVNYPDYA